MKYSLILLLFLYNISTFANTTKTEISCLHHELCLMTKTILEEDNKRSPTDYTLNVLVNIKGDPHEFEPSSNQIKTILKSKFLIAGPKALNPWINKFGNNRKSPTINLELPKTYLDQMKNMEAFSHFWLYPEIYCELKQNLKKELISHKIVSDYNLFVEPCDNQKELIIKELQSTLKNIKYPIILTHDALLPLLESLKSSDNVIIAIKGSGHHSETTAESVKKLYRALKFPKTIWILEDNIHVPDNILSKKRKEDILLNIDTNSGRSKEIFEALKNLNSKLKAIK